MSVRILTLFDDEPVLPPQEPAVKKKRTPKPVPPQEDAPNSSDTAGETPKAESKAPAPAAEKNYYGIGETAKMFKVRTSHIRFWTVQFGLKMRTNRKGDRLYTPENIEHLKVIHHLVKVQGFTIAGAKARLKELKKVNLEDLQKSNIVGALITLREKLIQLRNQI